MSIQEEIKKKLLELIEQERSNLSDRTNIAEFYNESLFDISAEGKFLDKLENFVNSI